MPQIIEIGEARKIKVEEKGYLHHRPGNPALEAKLIKDLMEHGQDQTEIAKTLGMSQGQVSKRLRLLKLIPQFFAMLEAGDLRPSTAYQLARLDPSIQLEYANRGIHITLKQAAQEARNIGVIQALQAADRVSPIEPLPRREDIRCPNCGAILPFALRTHVMEVAER